jgi:hypothetical protein
VRAAAPEARVKDPLQPTQTCRAPRSRRSLPGSPHAQGSPQLGTVPAPSAFGPTSHEVSGTNSSVGGSVGGNCSPLAADSARYYRWK